MRTYSNIVSLIIAVWVVFLSSCSLQKRIYSKGFYASRNTSLKEKKQDKYIDTSFFVTKINPVKQKKNTVLLTSGTKTIPTLIKEFSLFTGCDTIVLRSGAKMLANVTEIGINEVKFKNCIAPNDPLITLKKADISYILYGNGRKEVMEVQPVQAPLYQIENVDDNQKHYRLTREEKIELKREKRRNTNLFSVAGFWVSIGIYPIGLIFVLGSIIGSTLMGYGAGATYGSTNPITLFIIPIVFAVIALALSIIAIYQISQNKESKRGLGLAITAAFLSLLMIAIVIAFYFTVI